MLSALFRKIRRANNFPDTPGKMGGPLWDKKKVVFIERDDYVMDAESAEPASRATKLVEAETCTGAHTTFARAPVLVRATS